MLECIRVSSTEKWETLVGHGRVVGEVRLEVGVTFKDMKKYLRLSLMCI